MTSDNRCCLSRTRLVQLCSNIISLIFHSRRQCRRERSAMVEKLLIYEGRSESTMTMSRPQKTSMRSKWRNVEVVSAFFRQYRADWHIPHLQKRNPIQPSISSPTMLWMQPLGKSVPSFVICPHCHQHHIRNGFSC